MLQRLDPTQKAVPLFASKVLAWIGTVCSRELFDLSGVSLCHFLSKGRLHPWIPLSRLDPFWSYDPKLPASQGFKELTAWLFSPLRAPTCLAFLISHSLLPLWAIHLQRTIFSSQGLSGVLQRLKHPLFAADDPPPCGR